MLFEVSIPNVFMSWPTAHVLIADLNRADSAVSALLPILRTQMKALGMVESVDPLSIILISRYRSAVAGVVLGRRLAWCAHQTRICGYQNLSAEGAKTLQSWSMRNGYEELKPYVRFVGGLVDAEDPHLLVIDDLMGSGDKRIGFLTKVCHHLNTSCLCAVQNLFNQGKGHRNFSINSQYMVVFKNSRAYQQLAHLSRQMYPGESKVMTEAFRNATQEPYSN